MTPRLGVMTRWQGLGVACVCSSTKEQRVAEAVGNRRAVKSGSSCTWFGSELGFGTAQGSAQG